MLWSLTINLWCYGVSFWNMLSHYDSFHVCCMPKTHIHRLSYILDKQIQVEYDMRSSLSQKETPLEASIMLSAVPRQPTTYLLIESFSHCCHCGFQWLSFGWTTYTGNSESTFCSSVNYRTYSQRRTWIYMEIQGLIKSPARHNQTLLRTIMTHQLGTGFHRLLRILLMNKYPVLSHPRCAGRYYCWSVDRSTVNLS